MSIQPIIINLTKLQTPAKAEFLRRFCIVSAGDSTLSKGEYKVIDSSNIATYVTADNATKKWLNSFFSTAIGKTCVLFECGSDGNQQTNLQLLENFIDGNTYPCYKYSLPDAMYKHAYLATILAKYSDVNKNTYFSAVLGDEDPTGATEYTNWKQKKAFMAFYPSLLDGNQNIDGLITGIMASSAYDLSTSVPLSSLTYKGVSVSSKIIDTTRINKILEAPAVFTSQQGNNNIVINSRMADNEFWSYYYAVDTLKSMLENNIATLFYNASNTTGGAIQYNDNGIQTIKQNIIGTLETAISMGLVNQFARSYDLGTSTPVGLGDITAIDFATYIKDNPDNYQNGIYGGFSSYIQIQKFIIQIQYNITLG